MSNTVLITGASSGIGLELAKLFAADGAKLILVARREDKLRDLADELLRAHGTESMVVPLDLVEPGAAQRLYDLVTASHHQVDVLVNNAGFGQIGQFSEISDRRQLDMIQVNIAALVHLTHLFLKGMLERKQGGILNLASTAAFQPGPNCAVYYATKAFVLSFTEALWKELQPKGIAVSCLCPGPTETGFGSDSGMGESTVFKVNSMDVETVAKAGYQGFLKKKRLVMPGLLNNILSASVRFTPRPMILNALDLFNRSRAK